MRLVEAQKELGSGRHHDVGLVLGARTGSSIALRMKLEEINQLGEQAAQAGIKAEVVQSALGASTVGSTPLLAQRQLRSP